MVTFFSNIQIDRNGLKVKRKKLNECQVSDFICHISHVTFYMSGVICHLSPVTCKPSEVTIRFILRTLPLNIWVFNRTRNMFEIRSRAAKGDKNLNLLKKYFLVFQNFPKRMGVPQIQFDILRKIVGLASLTRCL